MNNRDKLIFTLLDDLNDLNPSDFISFNGLELVFSTSNNPALPTSLSSVFEGVEKLPGEKVSIKITHLKIEDALFYLDEEDFMNRSAIDLKDYTHNDVIFLNPKGPEPFQRVTPEQINFFSINFLTYKEILQFLLEIKEFAEFKNESLKTLTIVSKEYGVFHVGYLRPNYKFFYSINIEGKLERLKREFDKKEFIQFFKEIVVTSVHGTAEKERYQTILRQFDSILDLTSKDYEAYVSNFAIDKIKSQFKEERETYFASVDRSISSIEKQVVSFPLTFAASVFATYKVQDNPGIILLILVAYLLYTVIAVLILRMTSYNVNCLQSDVNAEENEIKTAYGKLYSNFKADFNKIRTKIYNLNVIIIALYFILILLFLLFCFYAAITMEWIELS